MFFQFLFTKIFKPFTRQLNWQGIALTEESQYDEIFTALKHPVRRQIILFINSKGEASFTDIQQETGINDTGLMSYHLKGLSSLVEQSKRGKYQLSEVGRAGITLLRKADQEQKHTSTVVHQEIERFIGLSIKKSVLFLLVAGWTLLLPQLIDIYVSTHFALFGFSTAELAELFFCTLAVMVWGVFLFALYDRHYYSKTTKNSIIHSTAFAIGVSVPSIGFFHQMNKFYEGTLIGHSTGGLPWMFEILRIVIFIASAPSIAYWLGKRSSLKDKTKPQV